MLIHTLNLTSSDVEIRKISGKRTPSTPLKGEKKVEGMGDRAENEREKGRERRGQEEWQGGREEDGGEVEERKRSGKWDEVLMQCCWGLDAPT